MKKMILFLSAALIGLTLTAAPQKTPAPPQKIATIDMAKVFAGYEKTRINEIKLKQQAEVYKELALKMADSLNRLKAEYKKMVDESQNLVYNEAERRNKAMNAEENRQQIIGRETELRDYNRDKQAQLREAFENMRAEIVKEIRQAVRSKCTLEGYTMVLDLSGNSMNQVPVVIYSTPDQDITASVLEDLNRGNRKNARDPAAGADAKSKK